MFIEVFWRSQLPPLQLSQLMKAICYHDKCDSPDPHEDTGTKGLDETWWASVEGQKDVLFHTSGNW